MLATLMCTSKWHVVSVLLHVPVNLAANVYIIDAEVAMILEIGTAKLEANFEIFFRHLKSKNETP